MARFTDYLKKLNPVNGRLIAEDGEFWNEADWGRMQQRYSLLRQTVANGAVEFGKRTAVAEGVSTQPLYYYLQIPPGRRFFLWQRSLTLTEGRYTVDLVSVDSVSGGVEAYKTNLSQGDGDTVQTKLFANVTVTGTPQVIMELPLVDTGTSQTGQARVGGAAANDMVLKSFTGDGAPVLIRVQRTELGAYTSSIELIAWEEDA